MDVSRDHGLCIAGKVILLSLDGPEPLLGSLSRYAEDAPDFTPDGSGGGSVRLTVGLAWLVVN
jgi:hypothetical protein